ncbi:uncharacterized protein TNCV_3379041 [Trichonephila clavipes]|nr:uncharacterized protein TNCV_3379041 [Trichonephila clavipes]
MITVYGCGGVLVGGTIPPHCSTSHCPHSWCYGLGAIVYDSQSTLIVMRGIITGQRYVDDILRPDVGHFLNGLQGAIFQQGSALPHTPSSCKSSREAGERGREEGIPDHPTMFSFKIRVGTEPNRTVSRIVFKDKVIDRRENLPLCHVEFRGP